MSESKQKLFILFKQLAIVLLFFQVSRVIFFCVNKDYFQPIESHYIIASAGWGIYYDLSALLYWNSPFIILAFSLYVIDARPFYASATNVLLLGLNFILLVLNLIDVELFRFTNKRTTYELVSYSKSSFYEILSTVPDHIKNFGWLILPALIMLVILFKIGSSETNDKAVLSESFIKRMSVSVVFIILLAILAHGVQYSRLSSRTVLRVIPVEYSTLALNTPFTLFESYAFRSPASSQKTNSEGVGVFNPVKHYVSQEPFRKVNVVILILESFSKEYMGYFNKKMNCTPFLDSMCRHSLVCTNAYANGRTTLESLPSILASLPSLDDRPFILSSTMQKPFESLPHIFNRAGYNTSFFYGARNGNLGIDNFARAAQFNQYIGLTDYNADNVSNQDFDGHWGIYDEEFLRYFSKKLSSYQQPFFSCLLTLSSHSPFSIPEKHVMKFTTNREPHLNSIMYADYALKQFFKTASEERWFKNTLFVLVGDHSSYPNSEYYTNEKGLFSIPIIYFSASDSSLNGVYNSITQQCDIMPSIVDYVHDSHSIHTFGNSIFDSSQHFAVMKNYDVLQLIDDQRLIGMLDNNLVYAYDLKKDSLLNDNLISTKSRLPDVREEKQLKALVRTLYNYMENNKFDVK